MTDALDYLELLKAHDWFYEYSDDHEAWKKGRANEQYLINLAQNNEAFQLMFERHKQQVMGEYGL